VHAVLTLVYVYSYIKTYKLTAIFIKYKYIMLFSIFRKTVDIEAYYNINEHYRVFNNNLEMEIGTLLTEA